MQAPMQDAVGGGASGHEPGRRRERAGPGLGIEVDQAVVDRFLIGR